MTNERALLMDRQTFRGVVKENDEVRPPDLMATGEYEE